MSYCYKRILGAILAAACITIVLGSTWSSAPGSSYAQPSIAFASKAPSTAPLVQHDEITDFVVNIEDLTDSTTVSGVAPDLIVHGPTYVLAQETRATKKLIKRIEKGRKRGDVEIAVLSIEEVLKKYRVPGASVAVFRNFQIEWAKGYGYANVKDETPVTPRTLFQAGSISKPVAAMAVLKAFEDGKLSLDDDINSFLTSWQLPENELTATRKVTPRMLLSHTGGTTIHGFPGYNPDANIPTLVQVLNGTSPANTDAVFVDMEPFTEWRYSGGGTTIMQLALMDILQRPYALVMEETVLTPIGMADSTFEQPLSESRARQAALAHGGKGRAPWHVYPEQAAAGLWTTATDLSKFAIEVQLSLRGEANHVLSPETAEKMVTPPEIGNYGLGFATFKRSEGSYFGHGGSDWGFVSELTAHREAGYGAAVMTNGDAGGRVAQEILQRIGAAYEWEGFDR